MTIEEMLRAGEVRTAENGFVYAAIAATEAAADEPDASADTHVLDRPLEKMVSAVPRRLVERLGRSVCYFVPWLYKQRRTVAIATAPAADGETRKELCHHLDVKPSGNLLLISLRFYEHDSYGLAMEFFDKVGYLATLASNDANKNNDDFDQLLRRQMTEGKPGELTPETWEWREGLAPDSAGEAWSNYAKAAEADALGLYMAALFTDIFYEDLFEPEQGFQGLAPELVYQRMRLAERLYPANRGYSLQIIRQRNRRRSNRS